MSATFTLKRNQDNEKWNYEESIDEDIYNRESNQADEDSHAQIYKQAISMALCKKRAILKGEYSNVPPKTTMAPVCGLGSNFYDISLYDAEHDVLLATIDEELRLFGDDNRLRTPAVLDIWLVIYHHLFCNDLHPHAMAELKGSCNLVRQIGEKRFRNIIDESRWLFQIECGENVGSRKPSIRNRIYTKDI